MNAGKDRKKKVSVNVTISSPYLVPGRFLYDAIEIHNVILLLTIHWIKNIMKQTRT